MEFGLFLFEDLFEFEENLSLFFYFLLHFFGLDFGLLACFLKFLDFVFVDFKEFVFLLLFLSKFLEFGLFLLVRFEDLVVLGLEGGKLFLQFFVLFCKCNCFCLNFLFFLVLILIGFRNNVIVLLIFLYHIFSLDKIM